LESSIALFKPAKGLTLSSARAGGIFPQSDTQSLTHPCEEWSLLWFGDSGFSDLF